MSPYTPPPGDPALPPGARRFGDVPAIRTGIFDNVLRAASSLPVVKNQKYALGLTDVGYEGPESFSPAEHLKAVTEGGTLARRLRGTWALTDVATGQPVAQKRATLAAIPYLTDGGTFVLNGSEYGMAHQLRLRPGVFAREKNNGELESHINVAKGLGHKFAMDPKTGVFKLHIGQAAIPLLPLLKAQGVTDDQLREVLGDKLLEANLKKTDARAIDKIYDKLVGDKGVEGEDKRAAVAKLFAEMTLDPEVTKRTLGNGFTNLGPEASLAVMQKLLRVNRGEDRTDSRDALPFQSLHGPEDIFGERFGKAGSVMRQMLWKATNKNSLDHVSGGVFNDLVRGTLLSTGLASPLEEINPLEILDQMTRVTRMGSGGIEADDAVPMESRAVQPTQLGLIDFLRTPESGRVGVDMRLARGAVKGPDGKIYTKVRNVKTGQLEYKTPQELADEVVAFPEELEGSREHVGVLNKGDMDIVSRDAVTYQMPAMEDTFSPLGNMVPFKPAVKGQRAVMASRMLTQALPLRGAEAPLVRAATPDDANRSFEEEYAQHVGARRSDIHGRVDSVSPDQIVLRDRDGTKSVISLHASLPYNRKTELRQTPAVKPGDFVKPGDLLARSNFTDDKGHIALGKNVRVAYLPWKGLNYEDAVVISQSAAVNHFASEHLYPHEYEVSDDTRLGKSAFIGAFPGRYTKAQLENFTDAGVLKPGTVVRYGDPLILATEERVGDKKSLLRGRSSNFVDASHIWEHRHPGVVTHATTTKNGLNVFVRSISPLQVGDKLSGRFGDKGVVSKTTGAGEDDHDDSDDYEDLYQVGQVVPDEEMPRDKDGKPFDVLLNPLGGISRINPGQYAEAALGKIAAMTGKPYLVQDFKSIKDIRGYAEDELRKHGLSSTETVYDPVTNRRIPGIQTGVRWIMKLHHMAEGKATGRGLGAYTAEGTPSRGGPDGSKRIGGLETGAMLSGGATNFLRDAGLVRGQADPRAMQQFMRGYALPAPKVPEMYRKYIASLTASGINPVREGTRTQLMPLTDKAMLEMTGDRELKSADTVDWKTMAPVAGGLFDQTLTGGHGTIDGGGHRWSRIKLHEPMPNPVMEEPIRRLLGLTKDKFMAVLSGEEPLNGHRGPKAIAEALAAINIPSEIAKARDVIASGKVSARDAAVHKLGLLKSTESLGIHPKEWMLSGVPVLPPRFRPVSVMGGKKLPLVADPNYLYKELFDANAALQEVSGELGDYAHDERKNLYNAFKAVVGLGDPIGAKNQERGVKGILRHVFGSSPKFGMVQRKLIGATVDMAGRAVITPDPDLTIDQVGVPEPVAWKIYAPHIVRQLVRRGMPGVAAIKAVEDRADVARKALQNEMDNGVVVINRAPTLHRYGMLAAKPRLTKGNTLKLPPLMTGPYGADFDGDTMQIHAPITQGEKDDAMNKLLPSRNLLGAADFKPVYKPAQEYVAGLYEASARRDNRKAEQVFDSVESVLRAFDRGEIDVDHPIAIPQKEGRHGRR